MYRRFHRTHVPGLKLTYGLCLLIDPNYFYLINIKIMYINILLYNNCIKLNIKFVEF